MTVKPQSDGKSKAVQGQYALDKAHSFVTYAKLSPNAFLQGHRLPPDIPLSP